MIVYYFIKAEPFFIDKVFDLHLKIIVILIIIDLCMLLPLQIALSFIAL